MQLSRAKPGNPASHIYRRVGGSDKCNMVLLKIMRDYFNCMSIFFSNIFILYNLFIYLAVLDMLFYVLLFNCVCTDSVCVNGKMTH